MWHWIQWSMLLAFLHAFALRAVVGGLRYGFAFGCVVALAIGMFSLLKRFEISQKHLARGWVLTMGAYCIYAHTLLYQWYQIDQAFKERMAIVDTKYPETLPTTKQVRAILEEDPIVKNHLVGVRIQNHKGLKHFVVFYFTFHPSLTHYYVSSTRWWSRSDD
jgi:hypothetical protein